MGSSLTSSPRMEAADPTVGLRFGLWHIRSLLTNDEAAELAKLARWWCSEAPLARPTMRDGTPFKVRVTSMGDHGWWSDRSGYRYVDRHPVTSQRWPAIPVGLRLLAERCMRVAEAHGAKLKAMETARLFDTCLLNYYEDGSSLGLHQDVTERNKTTPIVNLSIGATAVLEVHEGDLEDMGIVHRVVLESGDGVIMAGGARLAPHRIASIDSEPSLLSRSPLRSGRISVTFRRVQELDGAARR